MNGQSRQSQRPRDRANSVLALRGLILVRLPQLASLEGGDRSFTFTSGMAAIAAVCKLVKSGEHILAGEDIYGGTSRLLSQVVPSAGVSVSNVDMTDLE